MENFPIKKLTVLLDHSTKENPLPQEYIIFNQELFNVFATLPCSIEYINDHNILEEHLKNAPPEFLLNIAGGGMGYMGEDKFIELITMFEHYNIPYDNIGPEGLSACIDKKLLNEQLTKYNIPTPSEYALSTEDLLSNTPLDFVDDNIFPAFLKVRDRYDSMSIRAESRINNRYELLENFSIIMKYAPNIQNWLLQEYLPGPEYTIAVIGNGNSTSIFAGQFKFPNEDTPFNRPEIDPTLTLIQTTDPIYYQLQDIALKLSSALGCRDYYRMEIRTDKNGILKVIDVNPSPALTKDGWFHQLTQNWSYEKLIHTIVMEGIKRAYP